MELVRKYQISKSLAVDCTCKVVNCNFTGKNPLNLLSHYRSLHKNDKTFKVHCMYSQECFHREHFVNAETLKYHLMIFHANFFDKLQQQGLSDSNNGNINFWG